MKDVPRYKGSVFDILKKVKHSKENLFHAVTQQVGNIARISVLNIRLYLILDDEWIKQICFDKRLKYKKGLKEFEIIIKRGLITNNNYEEWKFDRTAINPLFSEVKLKHYAELMKANCETTFSDWKVFAKENKRFNLDKEMTTLVFKNLLSTLFSDAPIDIAHFSDMVRHALYTLGNHVTSLFKLDWLLPTPSQFKFRKRLKELRNIGDEVVRFCLQSKDPENLVKILADAYAKEGGKIDVMASLRQEALTFLVAGHETTATALSRICVLLSQYPLYAEKLREEITRVLNGRPPTLEDLPSLPYLEAFILEVLRLYPPVPSLLRCLTEDDEINGYFLKKGSYVLIPIRLMNHHRDYWENPEAFIPERFLTKLDDKYNFIYLPFGAGPRVCIGRTFAIMEMVIIVVMMLQKFDLQLASYIWKPDSGSFVIRPDPDIEMYVRERAH